MKAFTADRLLDGHGGAPLMDAVLLEENGVIVRVGPRAAVAIPDGVSVTHAQTLMPGMIDAHVHLAYSGSPQKGAFRAEASESSYPLLALRAAKHARDTLTWGFTSVRDMNAPGGVVIDLRDAISSGHVVGPRIKACGLGLSVTGGHMDASGWGDQVTLHNMTLPCDGPEAFQRGARAQIKRGADFVKINLCVSSRRDLNAPYRQEMMDAEIAAVMAEAKRLERRVAAHTSGGPSVKTALLHGLNTVEHGHWIDAETADLMAARGAYYVPTLLVNERNFDFTPAELGLSAATLAWLERAREDKWTSLGIVHRAGVKIALGTDAGFMLPHGEMNARELELLIHGGLSALEAITAATKTGAELMELPNVGTLETGKAADLLLVDGDPLADIRVLQHRQHLRVFKDGRAVRA